MSNLEHCFKNAIEAIGAGKDYDTWFYEEVPRLNASPFGPHAWAVLTDDSVINLRDIWVLAQYVVYTHDQCKEE